MLVLRILCFPIAMAFFSALYVLATKAPEAVEAANVLIWLLLPIIIAGKLGQKLFNHKQEN